MSDFVNAGIINNDKHLLNREFIGTVGKIAIPVALQSMLQSSFSIVDQLMIGQLGKNSIAAVGLGGNLGLIFSVVVGAIGTVAGIIISQFLGAGDEKEAWRGFTVSALFAVIVATIFMGACFLFANGILGLYTTDALTIAEGTPYLKLISLTCIPSAISIIVATWLRCSDHATIPLVASFVAVICNTGLNYVLIFGKFGFSPLGAKGAGYATLVSQLFNLIFMVCGMLICLKKDNRKIMLSVRLQKVTFGEYMVMIMPILISEFLWSLGQNINSGVYGHLGTDSLAAYTLTTPIQGLLVGALSGLSAAAGVLIGKKLGKKDFDGAYTDSKGLLWLGVIGSVILSVVLISLAGVYVSFYQVEEVVMGTARILLIVFALYAPVKVLNMILGGGIIRSGGDTKIIMMIDIIGTWLVGIPLCFLAAYGLKLSIVPVYAILSVEEVVRLVISLIIFKRKNWMRSLEK